MGDVLRASRAATSWARWPRGVRAVAVELVVVGATALEVLPFGLPGDPLLDLSVLALLVAIPLRLVVPELAVVLGALGTSWAFSLIAPAVIMARLAYRRSRGWLVAMWCAIGVTITVLPFWVTGDDAAQINLTSIASATAIFGGGAAIGLLRRSRQDQRAAYRTLERSLDEQRQLAADGARAEERATMAREMHDVVSHQISLIALQAGALRTTSTSPEVAEAAEGIRRLSVRANLELRQLLTALRNAEPQHPAAMPHTLEQVRALLAASGLPGELELRGDLGCVPSLVQSACYRAVQEGLSNVRKHAPGSTVTVVCHVGAREIVCSVTNTEPRAVPARELSNGLGLLGLRERVTVLGGTMSADHQPDGGHRLRITLPLPAVATRTAGGPPAG